MIDRPELRNEALRWTGPPGWVVPIPHRPRPKGDLRARTLELLDDPLVVHLTGITHLAAASGGLKIPYRQIRSVSTEVFPIPQ